MNEQNKPAEPILRWVKVENSLPIMDMTVLVCLSTYTVHTGFLNKSGRWSVLFASGIGTPKHPVIQWRLLPSGHDLSPEPQEQQPEGEIPEEIMQWIDRSISQQGINIQGYHGIGAKRVAVAMYNKMQEEEKELLKMVRSEFESYKEPKETEIQKLRGERDGWEQTAQRFLNQNCSLVDERDRSNTSFKKMSDLFDQKIQEARDYRAVLQEVWDNRSSTFLLESFKRVINVLSKYPSMPTTKE